MKAYNENIDIMKGVAIILVVVGHIIQCSILGGGVQHADYQWIYKYHMDVFFFCSGFVFNGLDMKDGIKSLLMLTKNKIVRLLIPYTVWSAIIFIVSKEPLQLSNLISSFVSEPRYGLWFLKSLFKYSLVVLIIYYILSRIHSSCNAYIELGVIVIISILAWKNADRHFIFFLIGVLFNRFSTLQKYLTNLWVTSIAAIGFCVSILFSPIPNYVVAGCAIVFLYNIGKEIPDRVKKTNFDNWKKLNAYILAPFFLCTTV